MSFTELTRPYPIPVRPLHRETIQSYAERLLTANFDTTYHRNHLDRLARIKYPTLNGPERLVAIAENKAGRTLPLLIRPAQRLLHPDGSDCNACTSGIADQYMCTKCAHGAIAKQHPHLDGHVCLTHRRWIGPGTLAQDQFTVDDQIVRADLTLRKLHSRKLLDGPFYVLLTSLLFEKTPRPIEPQQYPQLVDLAVTLTAQKFGEALFDPRTPYADRFTYLQDTLEAKLGRSAKEETIDLWLRYRPTMLSVLECAQQDKTFAQIGPHDLPVRATVAHIYRSSGGDAQPFSEYLTMLPNGTNTIRDGKDLSRIHLNTESSSAAKGSVATICEKGHRCSWVYKNGDTTCPICSHRLIVTGINNFSFLFPHLASEWHPTYNCSLDIDTVAPGSNRCVYWICPRGHTYRQSVGSRTRGSGCTYCPRPFDPARSISIARPDLAEEFDREANGDLTPDNLSVGSRKTASWNCRAGHRYEQIVERRNAGYGCPFCSGQRFERGTNDFASLFPRLAKEWDFAANAIIEPSDHISRYRKVAWICVANNHKYEQTIMHRIQSHGCPKCDPESRIESGKFNF